jgi:hypothetical protein
MAKNDARFPTVEASHHHAPGNSSELPDLVPSGSSSGARLKRATTVPFENAPTPRRRRRALRWVLNIAFWLVLLLGGTMLIVEASQSNNASGPRDGRDMSRADAYLTEVEEFRSTWTPEAIAALGTTTIGITLEAKYDVVSQTPRAYEALAAQCAVLADTRTRFDDLASVPPPTPPTSAQQKADPGSSARVDEATDSIAPLAASADELISDGAGRLETLGRLCDSLSLLQPIADARASATAASVTPLMVQPGASEHVETASGTVEFACAGDVPCQPLASPAREAYATATSAANTSFDTAVADFYAAHCPVADLAEYCALAADLWLQRAEVDTESEARFAKETPLNSSVPLPEYTAWLEQSNSELATAEAELDAWMASYFSGSTPPLPGTDAFVTAVSETAETAESGFAELRDAASAAASLSTAPASAAPTAPPEG